VSLIPKSRRGAWGRFALGALIVVLFTATTTAVAGLLQFKQIADEFSATPALPHARVVVPQPGQPQTILILGSDHRAGEPQSAANSDTIMLVRLNAGSSTINVISVPRDLKVDIPLPNGGVETAKINAAYPTGGPNLVVKTLQKDVFPGLKVNHIVDINFAGFKELVDAIGCVYTDVDRRYFNQNIGTADTNFSSIDIQAGYQKLCDENALAYVRYRHTDTDIVRSARQQDFIRDAKDQYGQTRLIENRDKLLKIFGRHAQTDPDLHHIDGLINLFNLVAFSDGHSIRTVHFPAILDTCNPPAPCYVSADPGAEGHAFHSFMAVVKSGGGQPAGGGTGAGRPAARPSSRAPAAGLMSDVADGKAQAAALSGSAVAVYYPRLIASGTSYEGPTPHEYPRKYEIHDPQHVAHPSYRIVMAFNADMGQFYGVQATTWQNAPLLSGPQETRVIAGKRLELHFDGHKLRLVAWRTPQAAYWVSNTLSLDLSNSQMLGIAASLTPAVRATGSGTGSGTGAGL
jgi:polyisoprenyl-teichoic acid--peptidoglycan teichoic acid transferase